MFRNVYIGFVYLFVIGCATPSTERRFQASSENGNPPPPFISDVRESWYQGNRIFLTAARQERGSVRTTTCLYSLRNEARQNIIKLIAKDIDQKLTSANHSLSEQADIVLDNLRVGIFEGDIQGINTEQTYWERYELRQIQRLDCYALASISRQSYAAAKKSILEKMKRVDPNLRKAIASRRIDLLGIPR